MSDLERDDPIAPPQHDRLGVLSATASVVRSARLVRLRRAPVEALAARWAASLWPQEAGLDALHFSDGTPRTANWVLLLDALNFSFWADESDGPRWRIEWHGRTLDGYAALAAALTRAAEAGTPLWDAAYLAELDAETLRQILRPAPACPSIPLLEARLANAREVGRVLCRRYGGQFSHVVEAAGHSAPALALLLARDFRSFADVAIWQGQAVPFLKRAQICVADLHAAFHGEGYGTFDDLAELTAFADYKLPQLLRHEGLLAYTLALAERVDAYVAIPAGSEEEVEIRAATIWAVEQLRRALARRGIVRPPSAIDYRLWAESQAKRPGERPYHRTRTIYY